MNKHPEFDFHKPFLVSLLVIVVFVFGFGVMGKTQKNVQQNGAAVALSKTTTTAGPPNPGQTVAQKVWLWIFQICQKLLKVKLSHNGIINI
jgi:hypothetical protein